MFARTMDGIWREHLQAVSDAFERFVHPVQSGRMVAGRGARLHSRLHRRLVAGVLTALAVLALTYSAASALVSGAADSGSARGDFAMALQAASANYRKARAECLALPVERRDACIAEAHADEARARSTAFGAPRKVLASLRAQNADMLTDAARHDSIVIEPACNVVLRGNAGVCEIQIGGSTLDAQSGAADWRLIQTRARARETAKPMSLAQWLTGGARERDHYFTNVAVVSP